MSRNYYDEFEEKLSILNKTIKDNSIISKEMLLMNDIITSKKIKIEIECLSNLLYKNKSSISQNKLVILGAELEMVLSQIRKIKQNYIGK